MAEVSTQPESIRPPRRREAHLAFVAIFLMLIMTFFYNFYFYYRIGPAQPIPFSHRVHAHDKEISCLVCHGGAVKTARAGVPPLETCMLCHKRIAITYPPIRDLRNHYFSNTPVMWERVNRLPDYIHFDHSVHVYRQIDCSKCHGDVKSMDRVMPRQDMTMGFCIQCHRDNGATHNCFTCHR